MMRLSGVSCFIIVLLCVTLRLSHGKPQDALNFYNMDDASTILQAAFAQAGVGMGDGGINFAPPVTRKPSIFSAARLRNIKLPTFGRRKVPPMPMLIPIMGSLPKPLKIDGEENAQLLAQLQNSHLLTAAPYLNYPPTPAPSNNNENNKNSPKAMDTTNYQFTWPVVTAAPSTSSVSTSTQSTSLSNDAMKRLPVSLTRPRSVNHNYASSATSDNWTPTHSYSGFKPLTLDAIAASSSLVPTASNANFSEYFQSTKRGSFWTKRPFMPKFNETGIESIEDLLKFHPIKIKEESSNVNGNKLTLPINQASLLEQINREAGRRSIACKNKDLGWCDHDQENYPTHFVLAVIKECRDVIDRMYVEVPQNLADFDDYVPFAPVTNSSGQLGKERATHATWSWAGYRSKNKALCDSERKFVRPSVAQDITGRWFVIVQSSLYHQQVPVEICRNPGGICNNIGECGTHARCVQKFNTQLLISIDLDKENDCPSMRLYRFPNGCQCDAAYYQK